MHGGEQTGQTKIMVAVQVAYVDIANALMLYLVLHQLHLRTFTAINQVYLVTNGKCLCGMMSVCRRCGRRTTQYPEFEIHGRRLYLVFFICQVLLNLVQENAVDSFFYSRQNV